MLALMLKSSSALRLLSLTIGAAVVVGLVSGAVAAAASRAYISSQQLAKGTLVSLDAQQANAVVAAILDNASHLIGVVVPAASSTLEFNTPGATIQVAESGTVPVLVSDINGAIKAGDHVAISPLSGVGMKQTVAGVTVGIADTDFKTDGAITKLIANKSGHSHTINIAEIKVILGVGQFSPPQQRAGYIPAVLQTLSDTISGRATDSWRILSGLILLLVVLVVIGAIIHASIRNSLISIGRNPLSSPAIYRSLFQLVVVTVGLMFVTLLGVYLVLTL